MNAATINGLWAYLQTLSLSNRNKQWLADKLVESMTPQTEPYTVEELNMHLDESEKDFENGDVMSMNEADNEMEQFVKSMI